MFFGLPCFLFSRLAGTSGPCIHRKKINRFNYHLSGVLNVIYYFSSTLLINHFKYYLAINESGFKRRTIDNAHLGNYEEI